ncbi:hypothetical protein PHLGIDRAFT_270300 [Phlebiopsis gigantea 11061_1 CR5-6]|uniref:Amino acid permease/ SLC12A domain-containing protein n=1 Tax=Phlebiopsis gigantea (strain 11061_1 CR5-6) TaxID=745531 RepID=A0A0C3S169_PHLG1|nr:hypothetical protein PHLGIDRAFT_270300 [Phlebiopsis gigantea 11061_1 CR5-6]
MERHTALLTSNQVVPARGLIEVHRLDPLSPRSTTSRRVNFGANVAVNHDSRFLHAQRRRIWEFQKRWESIKTKLPPQLTRRHIDKISIGGVIGTGLFLGSGAALYDGGPIGALLGYAVVGSVIYCLCVSIGEMIAFLPNVGGVVGLADLYVDPALGFSLGWAAWYNWSITLPAELAAAVVVAKWDAWHIELSNAAITGIVFGLAILINCFPSRVYGKFEYIFSLAKISLIVCIIALTLFVVFFGTPHTDWQPLGISNWKYSPFARDYLGITGPWGRLLGFWAVFMQASFSFSGAEVPGIAAGEVIDATRNVPRALRKVWIRITLFYIGGICCAGLLVHQDDNHSDYPLLVNTANQGTTAASPFVVGLRSVGIPWMAHVINAAALLSAWSAASSDVYISSRFLFFLAQSSHAPSIFASLVRFSPEEEAAPDSNSGEGDALLPERDTSAEHKGGRDEPEDRRKAYSPDSSDRYITVPTMHRLTSGSGSSLGEIMRMPSPVHVEASQDQGGDIESGAKAATSWKLVLPLCAVLGSASLGSLAFLSTSTNTDSSSGVRAQEAFNWLVAVVSVASLQSWTAMLFTYIRWHKGAIYTENKHRERIRDAENHMADDPHRQSTIQESNEVINRVRAHRHRGQPYLAYYAWGICVMILLTNGWTVFYHNGWKVADIPNEESGSPPISLFLSSYIPIPLFFLLTFGYKLIYQTEMVRVENMDFSRGGTTTNEQFEKKPVYKDGWRKTLHWLID